MKKIYYTALDTELGKIYLAGSDKGLKKLALHAREWHKFVEKIGRENRAKLVLDESKLKSIRLKLKNYLAGRRVRFSQEFDWEGFTLFQKKVWKQMLKIPYGETRSYKWLAEKIKIRSPRAVGQACGSNPLPIVVPCHRVIASDGSLGGYGGGLGLKVKLLELEKVKSVW
jgi:methylated-DNA-[protein]-cysteine S-methyltransferase